MCSSCHGTSLSGGLVVLTNARDYNNVTLDCCPGRERCYNNDLSDQSARVSRARDLAGICLSQRFDGRFREMPEGTFTSQSQRGVHMI